MYINKIIILYSGEQNEAGRCKVFRQQLNWTILREAKIRME